jgi:hypothetical protein
MALNIQRGKRHMPSKTGLYGPEGGGKSTYASNWPSPIFLDTEEGTHHLDVARVAIRSWNELRAAIAVLQAPPGRPFPAVVGAGQSLSAR